MTATSMSSDLFSTPHGLHVCRPWLEALHEHALQVIPNLANASQRVKQELLWQQFLQADLHQNGGKALPADVQTWHNRQLAGLFVLQADETVNIAAAAKQRQEEATERRCLKLMLTDGAQQVSGLEYQYIQGLKVSLPAGTKIAIKDATVRHGMLMLTPDNTLVLGGQVHGLEQAHQSAVKRWTQPPSGRSSRQEAGPVDLYAAASAAAWASDTGTTTTLATAVIPQPPRAAGGAATARAPLACQPAQLHAGTVAVQSITSQGRATMHPTASQHTVQATLPYAAANTPPNQLQHSQQATADAVLAGQALHASTGASGGAAGVTQTARPNSMASNNSRFSNSATNAENAAADARQQAIPGPGGQPAQSAPMHSQHQGRQPGETSRLQLRPALPVLQRPLLPLQPASGVAQLSPAQSGNIAPVLHSATSTSAASPASDGANVDNSWQCAAAAARQHGGARHQQVIDSSSEGDKEEELQLAKHSAATVSHVQPAAENKPVPQHTDADFEDYGNEPQMDEDMEDAAEMDQDFASASDAEREEQQAVEDQETATTSTPDHVNGRPMPTAKPATVDLTNEHTPQPQVHPAAAACRAILEEKQLQAIEALHSLPFTTLQAITEHAAHLPPSSFPKTLRLNAKLIRTLSKLQFKDEQNRPLEEYTIDVEIQDATDKCAAAIGHQILLPSIGLTPEQLAMAVQAGGKGVIAPRLRAMNTLMAPYMKYTLVDVVLQHSAAKPVIVEWHDEWTEADRAASMAD